MYAVAEEELSSSRKNRHLVPGNYICVCAAALIIVAKTGIKDLND
jgi:hypothetical protein